MGTIVEEAASHIITLPDVPTSLPLSSCPLSSDSLHPYTNAGSLCPPPTNTLLFKLFLCEIIRAKVKILSLLSFT